VEVGAGVTHILNLVCGVKPIEDIFQFSGMAWLNTALTSVIEKVFEARVREADYY
jgi:hypothetical protein